MEELISEYNGGASINGLSKKYDLSDYAVRTILKKANIELRQHKNIGRKVSFDVDAVLDMWNGGSDMTTIANIVGVSVSCIRDQLIKRGIDTSNKRNVDVNQVKLLWDEGKNKKEIAKILKCQFSTVDHICRTKISIYSDNRSKSLNLTNVLQKYFDDNRDCTFEQFEKAFPELKRSVLVARFEKAFPGRREKMIRSNLITIEDTQRVDDVIKLLEEGNSKRFIIQTLPITQKSLNDIISIKSYGLGIPTYEERFPQLFDKKWLEYQISIKPMYVIVDELGISHGTLRKSLDRYGIYTRYVGSSMIEKTLIESIQCELGVELNVGDRTILNGLEIDMVDEYCKVGIELNGAFFHTTRTNRGIEYHIGKTDLAELKGYKIVHVTDCEYTTNPNCVLSYIKRVYNNMVGVNVINIDYTDLVELPQTESLLVHDVNNLEGAPKHTDGQMSFGLKHDGEVVYAITVNKSNNDLDIARITFANSVYIPNGFKTIIDHIKSTCIGDIRYTANRFFPFHEELSKEMGMVKVRNTTPSYIYWRGSKHMLIEDIQANIDSGRITWDVNLTEEDNMKNNNYYRFYDCGYAVYST